jgi:DNA invertase Pin-like site-specific DNA recombinase
MSRSNADNRLCDTLGMSSVGYGRISTSDQNSDAQRDALTAAGCERIFLDTASGKLARRPKLDAALDFLRPGDTLVITRLDRLGRSVRNLVDLSATLGERRVDLRVLHQGIDTSTPGGKLTFHILGAIAEFERDLISERTRDGLNAARARGRKGGRRPKMTPAKLATARNLYGARAHTVAQIAEIIGVSRSTVHRYLEPTAQPAASR